MNPLHTFTDNGESVPRRFASVTPLIGVVGNLGGGTVTIEVCFDIDASTPEWVKLHESDGGGNIVPYTWTTAFAREVAVASKTHVRFVLANATTTPDVNIYVA
jgi:predicted amidohydrolase